MRCLSDYEESLGSIYCIFENLLPVCMVPSEPTLKHQKSAPCDQAGLSVFPLLLGDKGPTRGKSRISASNLVACCSMLESVEPDTAWHRPHDNSLRRLVAGERGNDDQGSLQTVSGVFCRVKKVRILADCDIIHDYGVLRRLTGWQSPDMGERRATR